MMKTALIIATLATLAGCTQSPNAGVHLTHLHAHPQMFTATAPMRFTVDMQARTVSR